MSHYLFDFSTKIPFPSDDEVMLGLPTSSLGVSSDNTPSYE